MNVRAALITPAVVGFAASGWVRSRPWPVYRALRRLDRVHESPTGLWLLSGHAEVSAALRHPAMSNDERNADNDALRLGPFLLMSKVLGRDMGNGPSGGPFFDVFQRVMLFRDPPDHTRLRSLVNKAFTPRAVERLEPRVHEVVGELLDEARSRGRLELMSELAYPLPARIICELLGVPPEDQKLIIDVAPALATGLDPNPMRTPAVVAAANEAMATLVGYLDGLIEARRRQPGEDLLSGLITAEEDGDRLSHDELVATVALVLIAGHETTANLLGNGLLALLRDRPSLERLKRDPELDRSAVEELLRFDGPVQMSQRMTLDHVELGGRTIPPGRIVVLMLAAANRDPDVFAEPERLRLDRSPNPHLAFGGGSHFCIGAPLARLEARVALRAILDRLPNLRLSGPPPRFRPSFTLRGLSRLDLAWH